MTERYEELLDQSELVYVQDIVSQIPETMGARDAFVRILNSLAERQTKEKRRNLEKLAALEGGGVDNWDGYDFSMEELLDQWEEEDNDERKG